MGHISRSCNFLSLHNGYKATGWCRITGPKRCHIFHRIVTCLRSLNDELLLVLYIFAAIAVFAEFISLTYYREIVHYAVKYCKF